MCRDGERLQQFQVLAARAEQVARDLQAAADQALTLTGALRAAARALAQEEGGAGISVTPVRAAHPDQT